jgi:hypothetical protein
LTQRPLPADLLVERLLAFNKLRAMARARRARQQKPRRSPKPKVKLDGVSIVFLGSFNPQIFQPAWLAAEDLMDKEEADAAEIAIVHGDIVGFRVGSISLEVTRDRFSTETTDATAVESLRDLVAGIFTRLSHTPVAAMGINKNTHYEMPSRASWDGLGHRLVPKEPWEPVLSKPGTRSVTVEGVRPDDYRGYVRVTFEPSIRVLPHGVFFGTNDHLQLDRDGKPIRAREAVAILADMWSPAIDRANSIINHLLSLA